MLNPGTLQGVMSDMTLQPTLLEEIKENQVGDEKLDKIRQAKAEGRAEDFEILNDGTLKFKGRWCVPDRAELKQCIMFEAHNTPYSVHPGGDKLYKDLKLLFWWPNMKREVAEFVAHCLVCQKVKIEHKKPGGLLQPLDIPIWKWDSVSMDFVTGLPSTRGGKNAIWVVVDRLTKSARFIAMKDTWTMDQLADAYVREVVRLHGVPREIVSDRDARFLSKFWEKLHQAFGTKLKFSTAFHPATDGQTERIIQTLEDMLRACALEFDFSFFCDLSFVVL